MTNEYPSLDSMNVFNGGSLMLLARYFHIGGLQAITHKHLKASMVKTDKAMKHVCHTGEAISNSNVAHILKEKQKNWSWQTKKGTNTNCLNFETFSLSPSLFFFLSSVTSTSLPIYLLFLHILV